MRKLILPILVVILAGCDVTPKPNIYELESKKVPEGAYVSIITGHSMEPLLFEGYTVAYDTNYPYADVVTGDVCVYYHSGVRRRICHMVYRRNTEGRCEMYGINNAGIDNEEMTEKNYVGKVLGYWKNDKTNKGEQHGKDK